MKRIFFILAAVLPILGLQAQVRQSYTLNTGQFDKIQVNNDVNVVYRCLPDSTGFAQFTGDKKFADAFLLSVKSNGTLRVEVSPESQRAADLPVLYVYSDFLLSAENSSNYTLTVESIAPCAEFKATQIGNGSVEVYNIKANKVVASLNTGNGTVNVAGECEIAELKMLGTGLISADRLMAKNVNCRILGTGSIGCWPLENLSVKGLGSTKIYYKGNPKIKKTGGGKLFQLPDDGSEVWKDMDEDNETKVVEDTSIVKVVDVDDDDEEENDDDDYQTVVTADD